MYWKADADGTRIEVVDLVDLFLRPDLESQVYMITTMMMTMMIMIIAIMIMMIMIIAITNMCIYVYIIRS